MSSWKTSLPREEPKAGKQHFVFSAGSLKGPRVELTGQLTPDQRERILKILMEKPQ